VAGPVRMRDGAGLRAHAQGIGVCIYSGNGVPARSWRTHNQIPLHGLSAIIHHYRFTI
jgi:hypothetical protein